MEAFAKGVARQLKSMSQGRGDQEQSAERAVQEREVQRR